MAHCASRVSSNFNLLSKKFETNFVTRCVLCLLWDASPNVPHISVRIYYIYILISQRGLARVCHFGDNALDRQKHFRSQFVCANGCVWNTTKKEPKRLPRRNIQRAPHLIVVTPHHRAPYSHSASASCSIFRPHPHKASPRRCRNHVAIKVREVVVVVVVKSSLNHLYGVVWWTTARIGVNWGWRGQIFLFKLNQRRTARSHPDRI